MTNRERTLSRDVVAHQIPSGDKHTLSAGEQVFIHQVLGGSYTVQTATGVPAEGTVAFTIDGASYYAATAEGVFTGALDAPAAVGTELWTLPGTTVPMCRAVSLRKRLPPSVLSTPFSRIVSFWLTWITGTVSQANGVYTATATYTDLNTGKVTTFPIILVGSQYWSGLIDWLLAAAFVIGGVAGGIMGAAAARKLADRRGALNSVFAATLFAVALYMLWKSAQALF